MSQLTQVIALLYRMAEADTKALELQLLEARKRAWETALREMAAAHGCNQQPHAPRREDLTELRRMSREDAASITRTWNREVEREITRLFNANRRGNRRYYFANLERWATDRAQWKDAQIALQTEQTTRFYAQTRFRQVNGLDGKGARYVFGGPAPVCKVCVRLFGMGIVNQSTVDYYPAPVHVGCPHEWRQVAAPQRLDCGELWLG